jgi:hypothetical protein
MRGPRVGLLPPTRGKSKYTLEERVYIGLHHFQGQTYSQMVEHFHTSVFAVSKYVHLTILAASSLKSKYVHWPKREERAEMHQVLCEQIGSTRLAKFGVWGFIDGTLTKVAKNARSNINHLIT